MSTLLSLQNAETPLETEVGLMSAWPGKSSSLWQTGFPTVRVVVGVGVGVGVSEVDVASSEVDEGSSELVSSASDELDGVGVEIEVMVCTVVTGTPDAEHCKKEVPEAVTVSTATRCVPQRQLVRVWESPKSSQVLHQSAEEDLVLGADVIEELDDADGVIVAESVMDSSDDVEGVSLLDTVLSDGVDGAEVLDPVLSSVSVAVASSLDSLVENAYVIGNANQAGGSIPIAL